MAEQNSNDLPGELGADAPTVAVPTTEAAESTEAAEPVAPAAVSAAKPVTAVPAEETVIVTEAENWDGPEFAEEFAEDEGPRTGLAATFLPGVDATAVIALVLSLLGAAAYLLVYPLVQAKAASRSWSEYVNKISGTAKADPFATQRYGLSYQAWGHIALGVAAILVALLVLGLWTAGTNKLWSRSVAQAALVIGLGVLIYGVLMKTGVVGGSMPSPAKIQDFYSKNAGAAG